MTNEAISDHISEPERQRRAPHCPSLALRLGRCEVTMTKKKQKLPPGLTDKRIRRIIEHYESQSEVEQAAEIEARLREDGATMVAVPNKLVTEVYAILAKQNGA